MIISILGTAGAKFDPETCLPKKDKKDNILYTNAQYDCSMFNKGKNFYKNSTHFLLKNFDEKFVFIGTKCAILFQKEILSDNLKNKNIEYREIEDNSLDDIFEDIFNLLEYQENIILDITHGFRHQPIMAIFASTLSQFLDRKNLKIIFAKEIEKYKKYEYISLNEYIEITQISLLLTGFIRTLNFIPVKNLKLLNGQIFEDFSESLLSNDLKGIEKNYKLLDDELWRLKNKEPLKHLSNLIDKIDKELNSLRSFEHLNTYIKYFLLSKLTIEKNYLIVSLTYIFESLREYCSVCFKHLTKDIRFKNSYDENTMVMDTIGDLKRHGKSNRLQKKYPNIHKNNKIQFNKVYSVYNEVRKIRNDLAHINQEKSFSDITKQIKNIIFKIEIIYADNALKNIKL